MISLSPLTTKSTASFVKFAITRSQGFQRTTVAAIMAVSLLATLPALAQDDEEFFEFDEGEAPAATINDPLEPLNRAIFAFNDKLYRAAVKPFARGLRVLPVPVRKSLANFFNNLNAPASAASALLQGDPRNAASELSRFVLNTTIGVAGFFDPATDMGLLQDEEDLGQTLARYGVGQGPYLVLPLYGATSVRDTLGSSATSTLNPLFEELNSIEIGVVSTAQAEVLLSLDQDTYEAFYASSLDPYLFFRSAWIQSRQGSVEK
jgi:phospholipid-binding lipoprotein MlaA